MENVDEACDKFYSALKRYSRDYDNISIRSVANTSLVNDLPLERILLLLNNFVYENPAFAIRLHDDYSSLEPLDMFYLVRQK